MKATSANYSAMVGVVLERTRGGNCVGNCR